MKSEEQQGDHHPPTGLTMCQLQVLPTKTLMMGVSSLVLLLCMYFIYPAYPTTAGKSLAKWTWLACNDQIGFFHGRFIPFAFLVMVAMAWTKARDYRVLPSWWGLGALLLGLLFYIASIRTIQPRLALIGAPFVIVGFAHYCLGWKVAKAVVFPAFFFWFAIPVPGLEVLLTGRLQILITQLCYHVGVFCGMDLTMAGTNISVKGNGLEIAPGCSGIRSLMALVMISAVYANYTQKELWKKAVLFAASFPLAIIGNFGRIFTILVFSQMGLEDFAKQTYHDWAGLLFFFPIALSGLYLIDFLLNYRTRGRKKIKRSVKKVVKAGEEGV